MCVGHTQEFSHFSVVGAADWDVESMQCVLCTFCEHIQWSNLINLPDVGGGLFVLTFVYI